MYRPRRSASGLAYRRRLCTGTSGPMENGGEKRKSSAHRFGGLCARCGFLCCDFLPHAPARRADARAGCALPPRRSSPRPSPARPDVPARPGTLGRHALERHALESQSATSCRPAVAKFANLACQTESSPARRAAWKRPPQLQLLRLACRSSCGTVPWRSGREAPRCRRASLPGAIFERTDRLRAFRPREPATESQR